ncbi:hypothetical protein [Endozoicomonas lisbonensis]|uniref:Minor tail protein n=1 Tax=Endozoicomonas lisbonensis TaxID=3120522 RepID=A0ABV2SCD3_9GAMM
MAYLPGNGHDFQFKAEPYQPSTDFSFYPEQAVSFQTPPSVTSTYQSQWQTGQSRQQVHHALYGSSLTINAHSEQISHQALPLEARGTGLFWGKVPDVQIRVQSRHADSSSKSNHTIQHWHQLPAQEAQQASLWDGSAIPKDEQTTHPWNDAIATDRHQTERFDWVDEYSPVIEQTVSGYTIPSANLLGFAFQGQRYTPAVSPDVYFKLGSRRANRAIQPKDSTRHQTYSSNRTQDEPVIIPWGEGRRQQDNRYTSKYGGENQPEEPTKPEPEQPDIRESYLLMNTVSIVTLPDRTPIELKELEINLDIDSFSWELSGELWGASSLAMVEPDQEGAKQIEVDINGWKWVFMVERYTSRRQFGQERYTLYGTSRTQLLAAPYAPQRSKSSTSNINAKQAISEELANTGFTAEYPSLNDYSTPDWIIPGGSFSYQNETPMKVIAKLTGTAGAVIIPARDSDTLNIQPRYPVSPWKWSEATMDKIIPASLVISLSASWRPEPQYNAVYVSGTHAGVTVNVKRQGTAGNEPAPDILEDWLTETQVNTERGRNELARGGDQSITILEIPLTSVGTSPGLIEPGQLVEIQDAASDWRGLCLATSIRTGKARVNQTVELERHY